jgi:hypothetical protein
MSLVVNPLDSEGVRFEVAVVVASGREIGVVLFVSEINLVDIVVLGVVLFVSEINLVDIVVPFSPLVETIPV